MTKEQVIERALRQLSANDGCGDDVKRQILGIVYEEAWQDGQQAGRDG